MRKVVQVLNGADGIKFGFGERNVVVSPTMAVDDAEHLAEAYPGVYVAVLEVQPEADQATTEVASEVATAPAAKPAKTA